MSGLTGFEVNGTDLSYIFKPHISGSTNTTGFQSYLTDLTYIFQPYDGYSLKAKPTGFITTVSGDLCNIFQPIIYTITGQSPNISLNKDISNGYINNGYTGLVFDFSGDKPSTNIIDASLSIMFNIDLSVNIIIIGPGGGGGGSNGGGGGGGGVINNISYNIIKNTNYEVYVGSGVKQDTGTQNHGNNSKFTLSGNTIIFNGWYGVSGSSGSVLFNGLGGDGGNATSNYGINNNGGGGGGGGGGVGGTGGHNITDPSNNGISGIPGIGGSSYNYSVSPIISIHIPFLDPSCNITAGGGGGSCISDSRYSGYSGKGYGGVYRYYDIGEEGYNDIRIGYGGGGGGGGGGDYGPPNNLFTGGAGGNGVVIIYWSNNQ